MAIKKLKKHKNPLLNKKYEEGFHDGMRHMAVMLANRVSSVEDLPGIGPKTAKKIEEHMLKKDVQGGKR